MRRWIGDRRRTTRCATAAALLCCGLAGGRLHAQAPRDLVEQALDQVVEKIEVPELPFREALDQLGQRTGLRFTLDEKVLEKMPYGARTRLTIAIHNSSVRRALPRVFAGLGLRMKVEGDRVRIAPSPLLKRLGRRLELAEVRLLERLAAEPWDSVAKSETLSIEFRIDPGSDPRSELQRAIQQIQTPVALRQLDGACEALGWVWLLEGEGIVFRTRLEDVRRRIDRPLDLTYQRVPLDELLVDLGRRAGVTMMFEPDCLRQVRARERPVDLIQRGVSTRQILERVCGNTGLRYEVRAEGVQVLKPLVAGDGPTAGTITRWVRIEIEIEPGVTMDYFLPEDRLPSKLREKAARKLEEILSETRPSAKSGQP
jgi:hypothetical protein